MDEDAEPGERGIIDRAIKFLDLCQEATSENRREALEDIRFRAGMQWPAEIQNSRQLEQRPTLTINKTDAYCTSVENAQRIQRPRIKVEPTGNIATTQVAQVVQGLVRHVENNRGGGDLAYDTAFSGAITGGEGYIRILSDYVSEDSFYQELYLAPIDNPFTVYFDPNSVWPDGSDGEECLITDMMSKEAFRRMYPGKDDGANFNQSGTGDSYAAWINKEEIRVAEYYRLIKTPAYLLDLADGPMMAAAIPEGFPPERTRKTWTKQLHWWKMTALEMLEHEELPGKFIPVVPVYGKRWVIDGKRRVSGIVRNARDPAKMYNYWRTAMTESIALAPKAKWLMAEGQDEGHENEWAVANLSAKPVLRYKQTDVDGKDAPPPQRLQPEPPASGIMEAAAAIGQDLSGVLGIIDPAVRVGGNMSGKALNAERQQSDTSTFNYFDNLTRSMAQVGRVILDLIPHYYADPNRVVRIMGDDGSTKMTTLNQPNPSPGENTPGPVEKVINDMTVGEYDVVMDTGPGLNTRRQEAVTAMMPLLSQNEDLMKIAGDLVFRNMDFPGADTIADRLAAANPLAQIDDTSGIPPGVQMKIKQMQQVIQQLQQQLEGAAVEIKTRQGIEQMKQDGETKRELMRVTTKAHDVERRDETAKLVAHMEVAGKAQETAAEVQGRMDVEELRAHLAMLLARIDERRAGKEALAESVENAV